MAEVHEVVEDTTSLDKSNLFWLRVGADNNVLWLQDSRGLPPEEQHVAVHVLALP